MSSERSRYFTQKDVDFSSVLPAECTWQRLVENQEILSPQVVLRALRLAKDFLLTAPGPNLSRRQQLAPSWFNQWFRILTDRGKTFAEYVKNENIIPFDWVYQRLHNEFEDWKNAGVLFVAGAEGHEGHIHAARWMREHVRIPFWALEQDSYFEKAGKARGESIIALTNKTFNVGPFRAIRNRISG